MKILLIEKNDSYRQQLILMLENTIPHSELVFAINYKQGSEILSAPKREHFDLVILGDDGDLKGPIDLINGHAFSLSCLIFATEQNLAELSLLTGKNRQVALRPVLLPDFELALRRVVAPKFFLQKSGREVLDENYCRVRISFFWRFNRTECDIYLRLSAHKFIKIIHGADYYDKDLIEKYANKKQSYLYITKSDFERFGVRLGSTPFLGLIDEESGPMSNEKMVRQTHALLQDLITSVGVSESAVKMANMYCDFIVNTTVKKNNKVLLDLFKTMRERKDYLYDHSYLLSCLTAYISKELQWHTSETVEKLCYAALFHDITLKDSELAMMSDLDSLQMSRFTPEEVLSFHQHPLMAAKMVKDSGSFPLGVEGIIVQHHETVEGNGFPKGITAAQVSPLVCVFILCHDFVSELYRCNFDGQLAAESVEVMEKRYQHGNYVKVFGAFKKVIGTALTSILAEPARA